MGSILFQIGALTSMNLRSLPQRIWISAAAVFAIAVVVAVLLAFLSMANGFRVTVQGSGSPENAIVMRANSSAELNSVVSRDQANLIEEAPGIRRENGQPLVSSELYVVVDGIKRTTGTEVNIPLRGIALKGAELREGVEIIEGRMFESGRNELVVGAGVLREFAGFELGREMTFGKTRWKVVGVFSAAGSVFDSELWADARVVQSLFQRGSSFQTVRVRLESPESVEELRAYVDADPRLQLDVKTEQQYFSEQSSQTSDLILFLGWPLGVLMALGALAGALNTMYTSVAARARDVATLRAIGFGGIPTFVSTLAESLLLAVLGGLIGSVAAYLLFDGLSASTLGGSFTQVVFAFELSPAVILNGTVLALIIGFIGGFFPAWRAARLPVTTAFQ
ncbi:MAG: ABC transporter permease [Sphingomonadales bacterium]|nr:ABC transporter permease [Sphingomonadales bacterium]